MNQSIAVLECCIRHILQISFYPFWTLEKIFLIIFPMKPYDFISVIQTFLDKVASDKAGSAGNKYSHVLFGLLSGSVSVLV